MQIEISIHIETERLRILTGDLSIWCRASDWPKNRVILDVGVRVTKGRTSTCLKGRGSPLLSDRRRLTLSRWSRRDDMCADKC